MTKAVAETLEQLFLDGALGTYLYSREKAFYNRACEDIFGSYSLQIGVSGIPLLSNRIETKILLGRTSSANLYASFESIPCDWRSVDLVALPHTLELSKNPHQVLNEVRRILLPGGKVVITGFNPYSLFSVGGWSQMPFLNRKNLVSLGRLKDWLKLLGFEINLGEFMVYVPAVNTQKGLDRFQFMEKAGNRWWPQFSAIYALVATKQVYGVTPIQPEWKSKPIHASILGSVESRYDVNTNNESRFVDIYDTKCENE